MSPQVGLAGGYRDSLLESVREAPTIWYQIDFSISLPRGTKMSAIDVTPKVFFERLY